MRIHLHAPLVRRSAAVAALVVVAACEAKGGREDYARDADTGAAAPATVVTPSTPGTPDSTAGVSQRTGQPGVAGDRQGQSGTAAIPNTPAAGREAAGTAAGTKPPPKP